MERVFFWSALGGSAFVSEDEFRATIGELLRSAFTGNGLVGSVRSITSGFAFGNARSRLGLEASDGQNGDKVDLPVPMEEALLNSLVRDDEVALLDRD